MFRVLVTWTEVHPAASGDDAEQLCGVLAPLPAFTAHATDPAGKSGPTLDVVVESDHGLVTFCDPGQGVKLASRAPAARITAPLSNSSPGSHMLARRASQSGLRLPGTSPNSELAMDRTAPTHGLSHCLRIPIAATDREAIEKFVGVVVDAIPGRDRSRPWNALCVQPAHRAVRKGSRILLWRQPKAAAYEAALHPPRQVWVHVDYTGYRQAYQKFVTTPIPQGYVLDHVQNRKAIRARGYSHPFLRLCPVSKAVNSSGGSMFGGEGMEKEFLGKLPKGARVPASQIIYADPMDITKMLNIEPGLFELQGVLQVQQLLFRS